MIELVNLTKTFKDGKNALPFVALDNVSLQIEKGDIYGIIGLSGAGKISGSGKEQRCTPDSAAKKGIYSRQNHWRKKDLLPYDDARHDASRYGPECGGKIL